MLFSVHKSDSFWKILNSLIHKKWASKREYKKDYLLEKLVFFD